MHVFKELEIRGTWIARTPRHVDSRGWLVEVFRQDWLDEGNLGQATPAMSYISLTKPGVVRGPHEHREQTDYFGFIGPSTFRIVLWDNRLKSRTFGVRLVMHLGEDDPALLIVPPGIVHAYKNVGDADGLVLNLPNRLFAGRNKKEPVDEIRYEDTPQGKFSLE